MIAAQPLLGPRAECLSILDAGFVPRFLLGWRFPCGDHLLGFAQPFASFR